MSFADQMKTDIEDCFLNVSEFGETVTYTTAAGTAKSIPVCYQEWIGAIDEKTQAVFIVPTDSTLGIASPDSADKITRSNGEVWTVIDVSQRDDAAANCRAVLPKLRT